MKIYLIRHGETDDNKRGIYSGRRGDPSLNQEGIGQAKETLKILPDDVDLIFCSSLKRVKQTTEIINEKLKLPITVNTDLDERDFGKLTGLSPKEAKERYNVTDTKYNYDFRPFGGEAVEDVKKRLNNFLQHIKENYPDKNILVITSAGIIRLMRLLLKSDVVEKIHNASIHEFDL